MSEKSDETRPNLTIIVVNYNTGRLLGRMFDAIAASRGNLSIQIIVVDNASHDGSVALLRSKYPDVDLIENKTNVGFGRANNQALPLARGRYLLLLNTDAFVSPDTLQKTVGFMEGHARCGVLGVKLVGPDGKIQPSCRYFPTPWNVFAASNGLGLWLNRRLVGSHLVNEVCIGDGDMRECDWVTGCYYLVRRGVIDQVGLFDPRFFLYYEEVDHCRRVRQAGWTVVCYADTQVLHIGGESAASLGPLAAGRQLSERAIESELLYFRKHYGLSGVLTTVLLGTLGSVISTCSGLVQRWDTAGAVAAVRYVSTQLRLLAMTRFATQPTR